MCLMNHSKYTENPINSTFLQFITEELVRYSIPSHAHVRTHRNLDDLYIVNSNYYQ